jgi:DNA (cytosine-5)-methyltransferase 1
VPAYYNENDPKAVAWLRELIRTGAVAPGEVDDRSILDVRPDELAGFTQCHFFAGIGVWSYALRLAGWPDDRAVWTGSCPCQPFSAAGKGAGFDDERHLWPAWFHLIEQHRPPVIFGEQVASKNADPWIDLVHDDLEALGYAFGAVPFPAAGIGAPHIRDRTYWMADATGTRRVGPLGRTEGEARDEAWLQLPSAILEAGRMADANDPERRADAAGRNDSRRQDAGRTQGSGDLERCRSNGWLADDAGSGRREERPQSGRDAAGDRAQGIAAGSMPSGPDGVALGDTISEGLEGHAGHVDYPRGRSFALGSIAASGAVGGFWRNAEAVYCRDGKLRPVEPGTFPLAHGAAARVGRLRGYGNAIVAEAAAEFIRAGFGLNGSAATKADNS